MSDPKPETPQIPFIDNPHAPEVYVAGAAGYYIFGGNIHITFWSPRANHTPDNPSVNNVVMARLVIPIGGAQGMVAGLYDFLKKQGHEATLIPDKSKMQ